MQQSEVDSSNLRLVVHRVLVNGTSLKLASVNHAIAPNVSPRVSVQANGVNLYDRRYDIATVPSHLVEQSAVIRRTLSKTSKVPVASPPYLSKYGIPVHAEGLSGFSADRRAAAPTGRQLIDLFGDGQPVRGLAMGSMDGARLLLRAAALTGTGIVALPGAMVPPDIAHGHLVQILPGCSTSDSDVEFYLFYSHRELPRAAFCTFVDFCRAFFREEHLGRQPAAIAVRNEHRQRTTPALAAA